MTFVWPSVVDIEFIGHTSLSSREIPLFTWKKKEDQISTILKLHLFNYGWTYKWDVTCLPVAHQAYLYVIMSVYFHWLGSSFLSWSLWVHRVIDRHEVHRSLGTGSCIYFLTYGLFQSPPVRFQAFFCLYFVIRMQRPQMTVSDACKFWETLTQFCTAAEVSYSLSYPLNSWLASSFILVPQCS